MLVPNYSNTNMPKSPNLYKLGTNKSVCFFVAICPFEVFLDVKGRWEGKREMRGGQCARLCLHADILVLVCGAHVENESLQGEKRQKIFVCNI